MTQTERDLLNAIHEHPDCDTRRLVYADYLQERNNCDETECIACLGRGYHENFFYERTDCPCCSGTGTFFVPVDEMRAESIRVSLQLDNRGSPVPNDDLTFELATREHELLVKNRDKWLPKCPVCWGEKTELRYVNNNPYFQRMKVVCDTCSGAGHIGQHERGLLLTLPVSYEWVFNAPDAHYRTRSYEPYRKKWARETICQFPEIRSLPLIGFSPVNHDPTNGLWFWFRHGFLAEWTGSGSHVPDFLFDHLTDDKEVYGLPYPTREQAIDALGVAVANEIRS